jgi:Putative porin/S-layer homology domain
MGKLAVSALCVAVFVFASAAFAAGPYDDVPGEHWAYQSLDYLTQHGVLEGYPDGFFKGDRTLTRYEFGQAVARLLDTIEAGGADEQVRIIADSLRAEFSDQLAEMGKELDAVNVQVNDLDSTVADLGSRVRDNAERIGRAEAKLAAPPLGDWSGIFAYRLNFDMQDAGVGGEERNNLTNRILFILGRTKKLSDETSFSFRFKTGTGFNGRVPSVDLGNDGKTHRFALDQAYVKHSPSWAGSYSVCGDSCEKCDACAPPPPPGPACLPKLDIYAGIFPQLTHDPYELVLDQDLNYHGLGAVYHFDEDTKLTAVASTYREIDGGELDDDAKLLAFELRKDNLLTDCLDVWVADYNWMNEDQLAEPAFAFNRLPGFDFDNDGAISGADRFSTSFNTVKVGAQYELGCVDGKSVNLLGEYMENIDSDARERIDAVNALVTPDLIYESSDDAGYQVALRYGAEPRALGEWNFHLRYKEIGANAIISGFGDGEAGWANTNSLEANWRYVFAENCNVTLNYINDRMHNAFNAAIPASQADRQFVQIDFGYRF